MTSQEGQHATFAGADIRGVDFRNQRLVGADFDGARGGVSKWWMIGCGAGALLAALLAGTLVGAGSSAPPVAMIAPPDQTGVWRQVVLPLLGLLILTALFALLLWRGIGVAVAGLAIFTAMSVSLLPFFDVALVTGPLTVLALGFGALLGGFVLLSISLLVAKNFSPLFMALPALLALAATCLSVWETVVRFEDPRPWETPIPARLAAAAIIAILVHLLTFWIMRRVMAGDSRYRIVSAAVVNLLSAGATRFGGADLSEASFAGADLRFVDLRRARLTRTNWHTAQGLERAQVGHSYLADPRIRQLVVSKQGAGHVFDGLDLTGVNLDDAELQDASLIGANLSQATLRRANLTGARLVHTQLYDTDLSEACITGAYIEHWGISSKTSLDDVRCDYVYMHLPTPADPDVLRKPDDKGKIFEPGDFSAFIAPIIRSLEYYHSQNSDPRQVTKTLDLIQRPHDNQAIDPGLSALALQQLAQRHPEAELQIVSLKAKEGDKVQIRALVSKDAERERMSQEFDAIYATLTALPAGERQQLLRNLLDTDGRNRQLAAMLLAALNDGKFYAETSISPLPRVKCLWLAANPVDTPYLRLDAEFRTITAKLRASAYRDVFQIIPVLALQPDDLLQALNEHRPRIVHFSGHGYGGGELAFVDAQDRAVPVSADALRATFAALRDEIRLVLLNACYSVEQTTAIAEEIDCVIGMSDLISDDAALAFAAAFYRALGFGRSIRNAFDQAVVAVKLQNKGEESIPRILSRPTVNPEQMILVAPDLSLLKSIADTGGEQWTSGETVSVQHGTH